MDLTKYVLPNEVKINNKLIGPGHPLDALHLHTLICKRLILKHDLKLNKEKII